MSEMSDREIVKGAARRMAIQMGFRFDGEEVEWICSNEACRCPICDFATDRLTKKEMRFCPNCGAKMRMENNNETD